MKGAIIGDIVGSIYEWHNIKTKDFPLFAPNCFFTDDSIMTLAVGRAFLNCTDEADFPEELVYQMRLFGHMYPHGGYGGRFKQWLRAEDPQPYNSFGNGAAMRCSPAGMIASSLEEAEDLGQRTAEVTHNHPHTRQPQPAWPGRRIGSAPPPACAYYNGHAGRTKRHRPFKRRCLLCSVCRKSR